MSIVLAILFGICFAFGAISTIVSVLTGLDGKEVNFGLEITLLSISFTSLGLLIGGYQ